MLSQKDVGKQFGNRKQNKTNRQKTKQNKTKQKTHATNRELESLT